MTTQCPKCKAENPADSRYCKECGTQIKSHSDIPVSSTLKLQLDESNGELGNIGPYKLLEIIGSGGMGTVYLAQQEKPVKRKVAIKVIKPGMDSKEILARFESEQQALALMNHPNIAQIYDSGETEQGYPYFIMEYVPGRPITEHCDKNKMNILERLRLFENVCDAIQHAHFRGIIHRDIKPTNVLVTYQDDKHIPKIIDFGLAKALTGQDLTEKTLHTLHGVGIGTPTYMSPEQTELTSYDVDTRTDIYSLGVLLYELLAGRTPFDIAELGRAGVMEILRIIREEDPPKPSTRFSSLKDVSTTIIKERKTNTIGMIKQLKGDLDLIVMKAIEKDRGRRYKSAADFSEDIDRFLNQEAIQARPPSIVYRLGKYVRKHKAASFASFLIILLIILASIWNTLERQKAEKSLSEANYNFAIALKEKAKAAAEFNQWQLVKLFAANSLLYQTKAQKQISMGDIEMPFGEKDWILRNSIQSRNPCTFWISPDCKHAVYVSDYGDTIKILAIPDGDEVYTFKGHKLDIGAIFFSEDSRLLAVGGWNKAIKILDLSSGNVASTLENAGRVIRSLSFSPNGKYLASISTEPSESIKIWDVSTGKIAVRIKDDNYGNSLDYSPCGRYLAVSYRQDVIKIFDASNGNVINTIQGRKLGKIFSPTGKYMAIGSQTNEIRILESSNRRQVLILSDHDDSLTVLRFSPDESILASGSRDNSINVYNLKSGYLVSTLRGHKGAIASLDFSHDNKYLVSGSYDSTVKIWDLWTGDEASTLLGHDPRNIFVRFSPYGTYLLSNCSKKINVWELPSNDATLSLFGHSSKISSVQFSPDGKYFASASFDRTIKLWDSSTRRVISTFEGHDGGVTSICFSPDGNLLGSGSADSTVKIWDIRTGKEIVTLKEHKNGVALVYFSSNGKNLFSRDLDGSIFGWELENGEWINILSGGSAGSRAVTRIYDYNASRKLLAVSLGNIIEVTNFSPKIYRNLHEEGPYLDSILQDVYYRDLSEGQKITTLSGHHGTVSSISISPDGKYLASCSQDKTIEVWDISSGQAAITLNGHSDIVTSVDFSPDGNYIISGSLDGCVMIWRIKDLMKDFLYGLNYPYHEKDVVRFIKKIEKETGLGLRGLIPLDKSAFYFGNRLGRQVE